MELDFDRPYELSQYCDKIIKYRQINLLRNFEILPPYHITVSAFKINVRDYIHL